MDAAIDDQAHRAQHLVVEVAETLVGIGVHVHRITERLRIKRPAFDISGVAAEPHEGGEPGILLREADLEVMARFALMHEKRRFLPSASGRKVVRVKIEGAGTRPVGGSLFIASAGLELFAVRRIGADHDTSPRHMREKQRDLGLDLPLHHLEALLELLLAPWLELGAGAHVIEEFVQRALEPDLALPLLAVLGDPRDFTEAELVHLLWIERLGGRSLYEVAVIFIAALHVHEAEAVTGVR